MFCIFCKSFFLENFDLFNEQVGSKNGMEKKKHL